MLSETTKTKRIVTAELKIGQLRDKAALLRKRADEVDILIETTEAELDWLRNAPVAGSAIRDPGTATSVQGNSVPFVEGIPERKARAGIAPNRDLTRSLEGETRILDQGDVINPVVNL